MPRLNHRSAESRKRPWPNLEWSALASGPCSNSRANLQRVFMDCLPKLSYQLHTAVNPVEFAFIILPWGQDFSRKVIVFIKETGTQNNYPKPHVLLIVIILLLLTIDICKNKYPV